MSWECVIFSCVILVLILIARILNSLIAFLLGREKNPSASTVICPNHNFINKKSLWLNCFCNQSDLQWNYMRLTYTCSFYLTNSVWSINLSSYGNLDTFRFFMLNFGLAGLQPGMRDAYHRMVTFVCLRHVFKLLFQDLQYGLVT
jgi:hypothetical protein